MIARGKCLLFLLLAWLLLACHFVYLVAVDRDGRHQKKGMQIGFDIVERKTLVCCRVCTAYGKRILPSP